MTAHEDPLGRRRTDYEPDSTPSPLRVLAVDDDSAYLRRLRLVLTRAGFEVDTAPDGASGLARLHDDQTFEVLITDFSMPGMDGIETVSRARAEGAAPALYTVLLTANNETDVKLRALDSGLDDFLSKQSSDAEIIAKLRSAARRIEMERRLHLENAELQALALTDELTGVANRRALFREAEAMLAQGRTLSVVLFDLDRFKVVNDTYGHLMGDRILADVAAMFKAHTRVGDIIGRYGGDEFVLLLPDTPRADAMQIATRMRTVASTLRWATDATTISIALTFGVATTTDASTFIALLTACDRKLYDGKVARFNEAVAPLG
jgi:two-component system chemotaxis response regulator CheY